MVAAHVHSSLQSQRDSGQTSCKINGASAFRFQNKTMTRGDACVTAYGSKKSCITQFISIKAYIKKFIYDCMRVHASGLSLFSLLT